MQLERITISLARCGKWIPPFLLIPVLFFSLLLAADHSLHEQWHKDAAQPAHQCAITIFEQQHVIASDLIVIDIKSDFGLISLSGVADSTHFSGHTYRYSASRAPPVLLSPLV
ncbi:MAG: hypothetical protein ABIQ35_10060 [Verrucomicrobiota bacterium]